MAIANGYCFECGEPVPKENTNKFFCSEGCRITALNRNLQRDAEKRGDYDDDDD